MCPPLFARFLGLADCVNAPAVVSVRSPLRLADPTMPFVELLMVAGAAVALVHAVLWWRRRGDAANLGLWCASVVYLLVLEPPLYFLDPIFVHNVFTVQFLYDHLPLYIIAVYPALTYPAYALVQRAGLLDRHAAVAGAACVAVVFQCFYEIFDQVGPQLRWWAWNPAASSNSPWLASVPLTSVTIFAAAAPFGMTYLTRVLLARGRVSVLRVVAVGVLTPFAMVAFSLPYGVLSRVFPQADAVALWAVLALFVVIAVVTVRRDSGSRPVAPGFLGWYPVVAGAVFLAAFAGFWAVGMRRHAFAGSLPYAVACALVALVVLVVSTRPVGVRPVSTRPVGVRSGLVAALGLRRSPGRGRSR